MVNLQSTVVIILISGQPALFNNVQINVRIELAASFSIMTTLVTRLQCCTIRTIKNTFMRSVRVMMIG